MKAFAPPFTDPARLLTAMREHGYALLAPDALAGAAGCTLAELSALAPSWQALAADDYLKDGGRYRRRRHACCTLDGDTITPVPHRAHWQPLEYNALHGGMHRLFAPVEPATLAAPVWGRLLAAIGALCTDVRGRAQRWYVEAHQFRIDTTGGIGRPTPEGAHRDGVDFVAVLLVARHAIKGGESRVFAADGPHGQRFTLTEPFSLLLLDDARVIHETTPIQPDGAGGYRDTLVLTYRSRAFLGEDD